MSQSPVGIDVRPILGLWAEPPEQYRNGINAHNTPRSLLFVVRIHRLMIGARWSKPTRRLFNRCHWLSREQAELLKQRELLV